MNIYELDKTLKAKLISFGFEIDNDDKEYRNIKEGYFLDIREKINVTGGSVFIGITLNKKTYFGICGDDLNLSFITNNINAFLMFVNNIDFILINLKTENDIPKIKKFLLNQE